MRNWFSILLICSVFTAMSQNTANFWPFGTQVSLNFSNIPASPGFAQLNINEGTSAICDSSGSLLFYSDGIEVWNRNHQRMPNGVGLKGHTSSTQSALILPDPALDSSYYLFTTAEFYQGPSTEHLVCYNKIDLRLDNGYGDVSVKNVTLQDSSTERIAAIGHPNGRDYWIASTQAQSNLIHMYLLDSNGINLRYKMKYGSTRDIGRGQSSFSPCGRYFAFASQSNSGALGIEIFTFNPYNGSLNPLRSVVDGSHYGFCFSPEGRFIYYGSYKLDSASNSFKNFIYQSPVETHNPIELHRQETISQMAISPHETILLIEFYTNKLSEIVFPEREGVNCQFQEFAYSLPRPARLGLPNFSAEAVFMPQIKYSPGCDNAYDFWLEQSIADSVCWQIGSDSSCLSDSSVYSYRFGLEGVQQVMAIRYIDNHLDTLEINVDVQPAIDIELGSDTLLCVDSVLELTYPGVYDSLIWSSGSGSNTTTFSQEQTVWINVYHNACTYTDSLDLYFVDCAYEADSLCFGSNSLLSSKAISADSVIWSKDSTDLGQGLSIQHQFLKAGEQEVELSLFKQGYKISRVLSIDVFSFSDFDINDSISSCNPIQLEAYPDNDFYQWSNSQGEPTQIAAVSSSYYLKRIQGDCVREDSFYFSRMSCNCDVYIPNAYTPNGDKLNDHFKFITSCPISEIDFRIYTRWGELIFQSTQANGWDGQYKGQSAMQGTYVWMLSYKNQSGEPIRDSGTFVLLR